MSSILSEGKGNIIFRFDILVSFAGREIQVVFGNTVLELQRNLRTFTEERDGNCTFRIWMQGNRKG